MKQTKSIVGWLLAVTVLTITTACQTGGPPPPETALQRYEAGARLAATVGGGFYLSKHPEQRPAFIAARDAIQLLILDKEFDATKLFEALDVLPIKSLESKEGRIVFVSLVLVWEEVQGNVQIETPVMVQAFAKGVKDGLTLALALTE